MARSTISVNPNEEMRKIFEKFDKDGDGKISSDEVRDSLNDLDVKVSLQEVELMMQQYDKNDDGYIDLEEFADLYKHIGLDGGGTSQETDLKDAFDMYDIDKNGLISATELHSVLNKIGEKCSVSDCVRMISKVDMDGDGHVNFEEFKKMMSNSS
ncbi:calcium-binding protein CML24 [Ricinus communis]|uniref:Calcium-binding allergen Ole e, putative n=1 Tax=Ricinus communis TaxID=3988 RepID=B9T2J5_RICCO|nr:calcium-binding protein CML24 [Ricinus communis]EEF29920.1 Calcium-binding allergen Ole e, putative [Ricinus communis]|eukprot:XP_015582900.1 calcium-binding protein CML24 [Ricinus communis]